MPASVSIRKGMGKVFNALSKQFLYNVQVKLLKVNQTTDEYDTIFDIQEKRFLEYTNNRKNLMLEIAEDYEALTDTVDEATHIQVDDDIYVILVGDTIPPKSTDVTWKLFGELDTRSRSVYARL